MGKGAAVMCSFKRQAVVLLAATLVVAGCGGGSSSSGAGNGASSANVAVITAAGSQAFPLLVGDGTGGAIIAWQDLRDGGPDIYAQRVDGAGNPQWTANGVAISTAPNTQMAHQLIADGAGGAIIVWMDERSGAAEIYAQRIDGAGVPQWTANGVAIGVVGNPGGPEVVPDGAGGAIIVWRDNRTGTNGIYAQRVDSAGAPQWVADGVAISTAASNIDDGRGSPQLVPDGAGGAIIAWNDYRGGLGTPDIYAQRVDSAGVPQWTAGGVPVSAAAGSQYNPRLVTDGAGGAIIVWNDRRSGTRYDIYAQRIDGAGVPQWTVDGVAICTAEGNEPRDPRLVADGAGGAIIAWQDFRNGTSRDIYAQRVDSAGVTQWTAGGVAISSAGGHQWLPQLVSDGAGGAIIAWTDQRNESGGDIYAQRIDSSGVLRWTFDGLAISAVPGGQGWVDLAPDGAGGAIFGWTDLRVADPNIYVQGVTGSGSLK